MVLFLFLVSLAMGKLLEYHLWKNYGQVIYDYSGNNRHGSNGYSTDADINDCLFTDRGVYLNADCRVTFSTILFPNPFSIIIWALSDSTQSSGNLILGRLFCRWDFERNFIIMHDKQNSRARVFYKGVDVGHEIFSSNNLWQTRNLYLDKWVLFTGEINQNSVKVKINGNDILLFTDVLNYQEISPAPVTHIGNDNKDFTGFGGFVWYAAIFNQANVESSYLSTSSSFCFVGTCSTCNPSFIIPSLGTGCGPTSESILTDSSGISCQNGFGCRGTLTIKCNCPSLSCEFTSSSVCSCIESNSGIKYQSACSCSSVGQGCCQSECSSCSTENECLNCKANFAHVDSGKCICNDGYFADPSSSSLSCQICPPDCETCSSLSTCTKCSDALSSLSNGKCICPEGYFALQTSTTFTCTSCLFECKTCEDLSSCLNCKDSKASLTSGRCLCIDGYFGSYLLGVLQFCIKCDESCSKCVQLGACLECLSLNSAPLNGICFCNEEFWPSSSLTTVDSCSPCQSPCKTCSSLDVCLSCLKFGYQLVDGKCLCLPGSYETLNSCEPCQAPCKTCSDLMVCLSCQKINYEAVNGICICPEKFYEEFGQCFSCLEPCNTCSSSKSCLTCSKENYQVSKGQCFCPEGYYEDFDLCIPCKDPCKTCSSSSYCIICLHKNYKAIKGKCTCPAGFYENEGFCLECKSPCKTCQNSSFCLTCSPQNSQSLNGTCFCQDGFFKELSSNSEDFFCASCVSPCLNCITSDKCLSCDDLKKSVDSLQRCKCLDGFYMNEVKICLPCPQNCSSCNSEFECTSCFNKSFEIVKTGKCLEKCTGNLIRIGEICACSPGNKLKNNTCVKFYFFSKLQIDKSNKLSLTFSDSLNTSLNPEEISIKFQNLIFKNFKLFPRSETEILLIPYFQKSFPENSTISIKLKPPLYSKKNAILHTYKFSGFLFKFEYIDPSTKLLIKNFETTSKSMVTVSIGISIISNPAAAWAMIGTLQLLPYIPLSKNYNESVTRTFLTSAGGFNLIPNLLVYVFSEDSSSLPSQEARSVGIESSVFWINLGKIVLPLIVLLVLWPFISLLSRYKLGELSFKLLKVLENYKYSVFLRFWIQAYLDIGIFSILNLKASFNHSKPQFYFNQLSAALAILGVALTPVVLVIFLFSIYEKISANRESTWLKYGTFFYEFKNNKGIFSVFFYVLYFLRRLQFILTQFYLNEYEMIQMALNMCSGYFIVVYLIVYRPFKDVYIQVSTFTTEATFSVIFTAFFIFSTDKSLISEKTYQNIVIFVVIGCIGIQFIISVIQFFITLKEFYFKLQELRNKLISNECKKTFSNIENIIRYI